MNKIWISFNFYLLVVINIIAVNNIFSKWMIAAIMLDIIFFPIIKNLPKEKIFEITGATWLQKKFKANRIIMDMTNE